MQYYICAWLTDLSIRRRALSAMAFQDACRRCTYHITHRPQRKKAITDGYSSRCRTARARYSSLWRPTLEFTSFWPSVVNNFLTVQHPPLRSTVKVMSIRYMLLHSALTICMHLLASAVTAVFCYSNDFGEMLLACSVFTKI